MLVAASTNADLVFDTLCKSFNGVLLEAKHFKVHNLGKLFATVGFLVFSFPFFFLKVSLVLASLQLVVV